MNIAAATLALAIALQTAPALKIVVLEGENGVNIIQQKTAVSPLVEVRDRNNVPVAGATVTFTIGGGGQGAVFAGGAQTLTVTTNSAGRAAAAGLQAMRSGAMQIQVQAAYQGQVATAAISQTNFATAAAAQASAGAGAGGGTSGAAGTAAGGGGGLSGTTIGIIGAAVAGGAVAAKEVAGNSSGDSSNGQNFDGYDGTLSGQISVNSVVGSTTCVFTRSITGTIRIELVSGNSTGRATVAMTQTGISFTGNCIAESTPVNFTLLRENTPVSGGPSALAFSGTAPVGAETYTVNFKGSLSGNTINGTVSLIAASPPGSGATRTGATEMAVTLTGPRR